MDVILDLDLTGLLSQCFPMVFPNQLHKHLTTVMERTCYVRSQAPGAGKSHLSKENPMSLSRKLNASNH